MDYLLARIADPFLSPLNPSHRVYWLYLCTALGLVLADEPTGNLDPGIAAQVIELLRASVKREGAAGILVTHSPAAAATADRVYTLTASGLRRD